jgi:hypothetical protein
VWGICTLLCFTKKPFWTVHLLLLSQKTSANYIVLKVNSCEISTLALYSIKGGEFVQQLVVKFSWRMHHGARDTNKVCCQYLPFTRIVSKQSNSGCNLWWPVVIILWNTVISRSACVPGKFKIHLLGYNAHFLTPSISKKCDCTIQCHIIFWYITLLNLKTNLK